MPLDPAAKRFLSMMAAAASEGRSPATLDERRQAFAKMMRLARADVAAVTGVDSAMPGPGGDLPYRLYAPADDVTEFLPGFVFFHGGGMVGGSIESHDLVAAALAQVTGCRLVSVGYRLAPEHKYPAAVEDAIAATRWVSEQASSLGIDAARLVVGGDSAGATLAAVICQEALRSGGPAIAAQCLICRCSISKRPLPRAKNSPKTICSTGPRWRRTSRCICRKGWSVAIPEFRRCAR